MLIAYRAHLMRVRPRQEDKITGLQVPRLFAVHDDAAAPLHHDVHAAQATVEAKSPRCAEVEPAVAGAFEPKFA